MFDLITAEKQFYTQNNINLPLQQIETEITKKDKKEIKKQVNNFIFTGSRSSIFEILGFLPCYLVVNNEHKIIELYILNKKICNIFSISSQSYHYEQWCILNNGVPQHPLSYSDKKIYEMINQSVDSFYQYIGSNGDIFPEGIEKISNSELRVNHVLGGHFLAKKENKTKQILVLSTLKSEENKLYNFLSEIKEKLENEKNKLEKEKKYKINSLKLLWKNKNIENEKDYYPLIRSLKEEITTFKAKVNKVDQKIDTLNLSVFLNELSNKVKLKDQQVFKLIQDIKNVKYITPDEKVKKVRAKDIKRNIKRTLLFLISGNSQLRNIKMITPELSFNLDDCINLCLTHCQAEGLPLIVNNSLSDKDYITENNRYLEKSNCYLVPIK